MSNDNSSELCLQAATPAEQSLHNNFMDSVRAAKKSLVRCAFFLAEIADKRIHRVLGFADAASYAAQVAGFTPRQASELIRMGRALRSLPELKDAVDRGSLSWNKARLIVATATPETEREVLEFASRASVNAIRERVRSLHKPPSRAPATPPPAAPHREALIPTEPPVLTADKQYISIGFEPELYARWEAVLAALRRAGHGEALADLHLKGLESLLGNKSIGDRQPHYFISILECPTCDRAALNTSRGESAVPEALLAAAHCDAIVERETTSGAQRRSVIQPKLRRAVLRCDRYKCAAEGCGHTQHLEIHHRVPESHGGRTEVDNLITLCRRCHRILHEREEELRQMKPPC